MFRTNRADPGLPSYMRSTEDSELLLPTWGFLWSQKTLEYHI